MNLQEMLDQAATGTAHVEAGWGQGRATYGGLVGGLLLSALKGRLPEDKTSPLRSVTVSFVAPVAAGPAEIEATILRAGSRATQGQALLRQEGQVAGAMLASFGGGRESSVQVAPHHPMPDLPAPESIDPLPYLPGMTPDFFQHVELRLADGGFPYSAADTSHMVGWMRFREAPPTWGEEHFVSIVDAWPPAVIQMLSGPAPASTLTWTLELVDDVSGDAPDTHWAYEVRTDHAADGYAHTHAHVWRPDGTLVAISRQTVAVFG